ncbi:MAG: hypothetical protein H6686_02970 [Fibrobacteria bacterium]|nr:hypothetical protein [Fibrobacteria bacterium]
MKTKDNASTPPPSGGVRTPFSPDELLKLLKGEAADKGGRTLSGFRIDDGTWLLQQEDSTGGLEDLGLVMGVNHLVTSSGPLSVVVMPNRNPFEYKDAAVVLAAKALLKPPVMTVQNAGKEDLKEQGAAWDACRGLREKVSFSAMADLLDKKSRLAKGESHVAPIAKVPATYEGLKLDIESFWDAATVPETIEKFGPKTGAKGESTVADSAVGAAFRLIRQNAKVVEAHPGIPMADLIWNYWMEEGGLVQGMNILALRFQNRAVPGKAEFLRNFELDALRPMSHFLWEYIESEPHRLSVVRRAYEYEHEYGLRLLGKAVEKMEPYERRTGFIAGFNSLIHLAHKLFRDEDDLQRKADAFPLLNQLQELQSLVQEGAHNQYPELVKKARTEMLMQQYVFTLPPVQEFIRARPMVVYEEPWMGPLDALRQAMGWDPVSVSVYHKLAERSESLITTIRTYDWVHETVIDAARSWAQTYRSEIQSYAHAYRTVTGVDLTEKLEEGYAEQPSTLIRRRIEKSRS